MKFAELKKNKIKDLKVLLRKKKTELGELKYSVQKGKQAKKVHLIKELKKEVARINTAITFRRGKIKEKKDLKNNAK